MSDMIHCIICYKNITAKLSASRKASRKFCSLKCSVVPSKNLSESSVINGKSINRPTIKAYLVRIHGYKCMVCGTSEWCGKPVPLVLDHINGDSANNTLANLRIICRNCDALTLTFSGRNQGKGRTTIRKNALKKEVQITHNP